jgi:hypothetical protein
LILSLGFSLGFTAIAGTPCIESGGPFAVDEGGTEYIEFGMHPKVFGAQFADGGGTVVQPGAPQPFRVSLWLFKSLYVWYTIHNAGRTGDRGKSKRRLKATPVLG